MLREKTEDIKSVRKDTRNFGLTVGLALVVLGGVFWWLGKTFFLYLIIGGMVLILCGLLVPSVLKPLQKAWMALAMILGWVMTRVILSVLFFLLFTTMGVAARLFGKKFLSLKWKRAEESYWNYREVQKYDKRRSETQF